MTPKLRLITDLQAEKLIYDQKVRESANQYKYLIIQALSFNCLKEYTEIISLNLQFSRTQNVDEYIRGLDKYKYLFEHGVPSKGKMKAIRDVFTYIRNESTFRYNSKEEFDCRNLITRILVRAIIFNKEKEIENILSIAAHFKQYRNIQYFNHSISQYLCYLRSPHEKN